MRGFSLLLILVILGQVCNVNAEATLTENSSSPIIVEELNVYIGQVVKIIFPNDFISISAEQGFPKWLEVHKGAFVGVPDIENIGQTDVNIETAQHGTTVFRITVNYEKMNPCGDNVTSWIDSYFNESPTVNNMVKAAENIRLFSSKLDGKKDTLRVYSRKYGSMNRDLEAIDQKVYEGTFIVSFAASCKSLWHAANIMDDFLDFDNATKTVRLARGYFKLGPATFTSTTALATTSATITANTPAITKTLIPETPKVLKAVCTRGSLCKVHVPLFTFGEEDRKVRDGTIGIIPSKHEEHFLYYGNNRHFTGYPMTEGNFTSQITKTHDNATTDYVLLMMQVNAQPDSTHYIQLDMSRPSCSDIIEKPSVRIDFMNQLYHALKGPKESLMIHEIACVNNVTRVRFSNITIETDTCDVTEIRNFSVKMVTEHLQKTNYGFIQAMNTVATVRKATLVLSGRCEDLKPPKTTSDPTTPIPEHKSENNWLKVFLMSLVPCCIFVMIICMTCHQNFMKNKRTYRTTEPKLIKYRFTVNLETIEEEPEDVKSKTTNPDLIKNNFPVNL